MNFIASNGIFAALAQVSTWLDSAIAIKNKFAPATPDAAEPARTAFTTVHATQSANSSNPEQKRAVLKLIVSGKKQTSVASTDASQSFQIRDYIDQGLNHQNGIVDYADIMELLDDICTMADSIPTLPSCFAKTQKCQHLLENLNLSIEFTLEKYEHIGHFANITNRQFQYQSYAYFEQFVHKGVMETLEHVLITIHKSTLTSSIEKRSALLDELDRMESLLDKLMVATNNTEIAERINDFDSDYLRSIRARLSLGLAL